MQGLQDLAGAIIGTVGGSLCTGSVAWWFAKNYVRDLQTELERMKREEIGGLHTRVAKIEDRCRAEQTANDVHNLVGWMKKLDGNIGLMMDRSANTVAAIDGLKTWLGNLNTDYQAHQRDRQIHGGR